MILTKQVRQSPVKSGNASPYRKNRQIPLLPCGKIPKMTKKSLLMT